MSTVGPSSLCPLDLSALATLIHLPLSCNVINVDIIDNAAQLVWKSLGILCAFISIINNLGNQLKLIELQMYIKQELESKC